MLNLKLRILQHFVQNHLFMFTQWATCSLFLQAFDQLLQIVLANTTVGLETRFIGEVFDESRAALGKPVVDGEEAGALTEVAPNGGQSNTVQCTGNNIRESRERVLKMLTGVRLGSGPHALDC